MNMKERAHRLKKELPVVFRALQRKETPWIAKAMACIVICYALSPIDLIPDFIPVLGYLDDLLLLPGLIYLTIKLIPQDILEACRMDSEQHVFSSGKKCYYSLPIPLIWTTILLTVLYAIRK